MNNNYSQKPLHKTVHFRRLREVLHLLTEKEGVNLKDYDVNNIRCYQTYGLELKGKNVTVTNVPNSRTCFVSNNKYDMFEIPSVKNKKGSCVGKFLVLIKNVSFNYYMLAELEYKILGTKNGHLVDEAVFYVYGQYSIESNTKRQFIKKLAAGKNCDFGDSKLQARGFDSSDFRKSVGYGTSAAKMFAASKHIKVNNLTVVDNSEVKIYKKKGRK